jgi:hypothetical protein
MSLSFYSLAMRFPELEKESLGMARKRREGSMKTVGILLAVNLSSTLPASDSLSHGGWQ